MELTGPPFILGLPVLATPAVMAIWYRGLANRETACTASILSMIFVAAVVPIVTVPMRWGPHDHDGPAAGIPYFAALIESFWIFWLGLALVLLFHGPFGKLVKRRDKDETEVFE